MKNYFKAHLIPLIPLIFIVLLASFFRLYGLNWDQGNHLHPDERMLVMVTEKIRWPATLPEFFSPESSFNPKFFAYGSFPIYLLRLTANISASLLKNPLLANYSLLNIVGRVLSALSDMGTILLIFKLGKKVFSTSVGLLSSVFYAFCAFPIQLSHFFAVDTFLTFFVVLTLYRLIIFYEKPCSRNAFFSAISFGMGLATKVSATVLSVSIGTAIIVDLVLVIARRIRLVLKHQKIFYSSEKKINVVKNKITALARFILVNTKFIMIIIFITFITFIILEPYGLIDFQTFWRQTKEQQAMTKNAYVFPYTLQYVDTIPYLYHLKNFVLWGAGAPLGIVSVAAVIYLMFCLVREFPKPGNEEQEAKMLILFSFFFVYFLVVGRFAVKFMRYLLPLYPTLFLFASWSLLSLLHRSKKMCVLLAILVLLPTFLWSTAFLSIYSKPNTRTTASEWINQNIPAGSSLAVEHWDDRLPTFGGEKYHFLEMPMYENDFSDTKWEKVNSNLKKADYLILASNRLYVPLQKLADCQKYKVCYPKTAQYYQDLFSENLGFNKVAEFSAYPMLEIGNRKLEINDSSADESFTVYDHPKIIIFKKDGKNY